jgi:DNA helicase HerA-like ATPase
MTSDRPFKLALSIANNKDNFQAFCMMLVQVACSTKPVTVLIEEVHQCTGSAQAEGYWGDLLTRSRKYGVRLVVISPRPQQCDKTTITSCNIKYVCKLGRQPDRKYMADEMGLTAGDIERIGRLNVPNHKVHWWYQGEEGDAIAMCHDFKKGETERIRLEVL